MLNGITEQSRQDLAATFAVSLLSMQRGLEPFPVMLTDSHTQKWKRGTRWVVLNSRRYEYTAEKWSVTETEYLKGWWVLSRASEPEAPLFPPAKRGKIAPTGDLTA